MKDLYMKLAELQAESRAPRLDKVEVCVCVCVRESVHVCVRLCMHFSADSRVPRWTKSWCVCVCVSL